MKVILENWRKYLEEGWPKKQKGQPGGYGTLMKPKYMTTMDKAGTAFEAVKRGETLHGWDKYAQLVAEAYVEAPEHEERAVPAFNKLGHHILKTFPKVASAYPVSFVSGQPYDSAEEMAKKVKETGKMLISKDFNQAGFFGEMENLMFRAVHDYFAHLKAKGHEADSSKVASFTYKGELRAANYHTQMLPGSIAAHAIFTEVVGQASHFYYFGHFPDQKIAFLTDFDPFRLGVVDGYDIVNGDLVKR